MSIKKVYKDQPDTFEFNSKKLKAPIRCNINIIDTDIAAIMLRGKISFFENFFFIDLIILSRVNIF